MRGVADAVEPSCWLAQPTMLVDGDAAASRARSTGQDSGSCGGGGFPLRLVRIARLVADFTRDRQQHAAANVGEQRLPTGGVAAPKGVATWQALGLEPGAWAPAGLEPYASPASRTTSATRRHTSCDLASILHGCYHTLNKPLHRVWFAVTCALDALVLMEVLRLAETGQREDGYVMGCRAARTHPSACCLLTAGYVAALYQV